MPPASEAAATSSGLEHGYIAPQISGTSMPSFRVSGVSSRDIANKDIENEAGILCW